VLDAGEQCDDGNTAPGDGCSTSCQVEGGYSCTDPVPANMTNLVADPGFEAGLMGGVWQEYSFNFDTPICSDADCGYENGPRTGTYWAWFGGIGGTVEDASVTQVVQIPATAVELRFWLRLPDCNTASDFFEVLVDDSNVFAVFGDDGSCGDEFYSEQVVDISSRADGAEHTIQFYGATDSLDVGAYTSFFLDDILLIHGPADPMPSICSVTQQLIFADGFESPASP
jgi:cysteine-rich repeat protein